MLPNHNKAAESLLLRYQRGHLGNEETSVAGSGRLGPLFSQARDRISNSPYVSPGRVPITEGISQGHCWENGVKAHTVIRTSRTRNRPTTVRPLVLHLGEIKDPGLVGRNRILASYSCWFLLTERRPVPAEAMLSVTRALRFPSSLGFIFYRRRNPLRCGHQGITGQAG